MDTVSFTLQNLLADFLAFLPRLVAALVLFLISLYFAGFLTKLILRTLERRNTDRELRILIGQISRWTIIIIGLVLSLQQVGFDVSAFLAGLGILGFTVGFALQDVSKNFVSGLLLLLQQPFEIGDVIEVGGYIGTVADINLRATEIYTPDGQNVLIPNGDVFTSAIKNYSRFHQRRMEINVGVAYGSDLNRVRAVALEAISTIEGLLLNPAPSVVFHNFGDSSIDFTVYFWIDLNIANYLNSLDTGIVKINTAFVANEIDIPFPVRTVLLAK